MTTLIDHLLTAWHKNIHDDLVLAVALACWAGERLGGEVMLPFRI